MNLEHAITERYCRNNFGVIHKDDIEKIGTEFHMEEKDVLELLQKCNCEIYTGNVITIDDLRPYADEISKFILHTEKRKPRYAQKMTVREKIGQVMWNKVRAEKLKQCNNTCEICGYHTDSVQDLDVHEVWNYDEKKHYLILTSITLICKRCHSCKHVYYNVLSRGNDNAKIKRSNDIRNMHMMLVNKCSEKTLRAYNKQKNNFKKTPENWNEYLLKLQFLDYDKWEKEMNKYNELCAVKWKFLIDCDMPFKDEIIEKLRKKDLYFN